MTEQTADAAEGLGTSPGGERRLGRNVGANLAGTIVTGGAAFALTLVITHSLNRSDAGVFFAATSLFLLANALGLLGTQTGLVYFLPRARALGRPRRQRSYVQVAIRPVLALAVLLAVALLIFAPQVAEVTNPDHTHTATVYLRTLAIFLPVAALEMVMLAVTRGFGTMRVHASTELIGRPLLQLILVAGVAFTSSNLWIAAAWGLPYVPAAVVALVWCRRLLASADTRAANAHPVAELDIDGIEDSPEAVRRSFWRYSAPRAVTSVAQVAMQRFDIVLVAAMASASQAAVYAATTRFVVVGQMAGNAISLAAQPRMSHLIARGDMVTASRVYRVSTAWLMMLSWPLYLTMLCFGTVLVRVFGDGYSAGADVLVLLALAMMLSTACGMVEMVLAMAGKTSWNMINMFAAIVLQVGLDIWLIPEHGLIGAAIGWSAAIAARNLAALALVRWALGIHPFGGPFVWITLLSSSAYLLAFAAAVGAFDVSLRALMSGFFIGSIAYLAGLWLLRKPLELSALVNVRRSRR